MNLSISSTALDELLEHLLSGFKEEVAFLFAHANTSGSSLVVHRWIAVPREKLLIQEPDRFAIDASFVAAQLKAARINGESVLLAHSHPAADVPPFFSHADDMGEQAFYRILRIRCPGLPHGAMVASPRGVLCRILRSQGSVAESRACVLTMMPEPDRTATLFPQHDRQLLMWGSRGQEALSKNVAAIVGLGGTGSITAQQLIHLGVGKIIAIDDDIVQESNLSRVVGATLADINRTPKVEIVARTAAAVDPSVTVERHQSKDSG